jgi:ABC-type uncharacterized transport system involved in gliding motility auxiliary subunit
MLTNLIGLLGILLVVGGGLVYAINTVITTASASLIFAGLLLLLIYFYINFARIRDLLLKRSSKYGANMAVMILIFLCVLALIGVMSMRYKKRIDLTATNRYTLSEQTKKILRSLKKEIEAVAFYRADERTRQAMEDLLQEYSYYSPRFKYQFVDPDRTPAKAAKYGVSSYRTTLFIAGKRQETVALESEEKLTRKEKNEKVSENFPSELGGVHPKQYPKNGSKLPLQSFFTLKTYQTTKYKFTALKTKIKHHFEILKMKVLENFKNQMKRK